jgi:hypothetical protein
VSEVLLPIALLASGLAAGVLLGAAMGPVPFYMTLPPGQYVRAHAFAAGRYDPLQPACLLITVVADAAIAVTGGPGRAPAIVGAVLAAAVVCVSLTRNVPVNRWLKSLDPDALPPDWSSRDPRRFWARWNRIRTVLAVLALAANAVTAGVVQ